LGTRHIFGWHLPLGGEYSVGDSVEERSEEGRRLAAHW